MSWEADQNLFMISDIKFYFGIIAGSISFIAYLIYFYSILKGKSKPSRVTWWIWAFMGGVSALSYYSSGARYTIWSPIVEFIGPLITALLSVKYGDGGIKRKTDVFCLLGGILSVILWAFTGSPEAALMLNILIDAFAIFPTIKKSYLHPKTESRLAWSGTTFADFINLFAIEKMKFIIIIYPLWMFIEDIVILGLLEKDIFMSKKIKRNK